MLMTIFSNALNWLGGMLQAPGGDPARNMNFLFAGFVVVWVLLLSYIFSLVRRQKRLEAEIEMLRQMKQEK
jgi:CcmD family protein